MSARFKNDLLFKDLTYQLNNCQSNPCQKLMFPSSSRGVSISLAGKDQFG